MSTLLCCVGEAICSQGVRGIMGLLPMGEQIYDVASDALGRYKHRHQELALKTEVQNLIRGSVAEIPKASPNQINAIEAKQVTPVIRPTIATLPVPRISSYNIDKYSSPATKETLVQLETFARAAFRMGTVERLSGSSSVSVAGKVIVKFVPQEHGAAEFVLLGVSTTLNQNTWAGISLDGPKGIGSANRAQAFYTFQIANVDQLEPAQRILADVAAQF